MAAAARAGRKRSDIQLVAVTKKFPPRRFARPMRSLRDFGENYVQEFETKRRNCPIGPTPVTTLSGHLQSNKSKKAAEIFNVIHTVDSANRPPLKRRL